MSILSKSLSVYVLYSLLRKLTTPFEKTKAFELGIIDKDGKFLKKKKDLKTKEEKEAFTLNHILAFKLKRLLGKIPGGKKTISSYIAALWLISENKEYQDALLLEESPTNSMGNSSHASGSVAIMDKPITVQKTSKFAGKQVFELDPEDYHKCKVAKTRYQRYKKFVNAELAPEISAWAKKNPGRAILVKNARNGSMYYLKYGKK